ncbi:hypothetical protein [Tumebacillus permanentifrigoris]|uniref:Uncharacterized protein n=1 Tax=Tumebacillus permanentifrigoris TaxID=378543 RepID=A0A316D9N9_9BACL|nr:hypothetical protein [Tumebacillus permanentifrigoris]PWK13058.1 hypothetical protein C7459_10876 [Tumebacillus permanentifrigoris]
MFVVPHIILKLCWLIIFARSGYKTYQLLQPRRKDWFDIIFYLAIAIVALGFI